MIKREFHAVCSRDNNLAFRTGATSSRSIKSYNDYIPTARSKLSVCQGRRKEKIPFPCAGLQSYIYLPPDNVHWLKSISFPQLWQRWVLSNSSEKISLVSPQDGHLHSNDFRFLNCSYPGQCCGVDMVTSWSSFIAFSFIVYIDRGRLSIAPIVLKLSAFHNPVPSEHRRPGCCSSGA